MATFIFVLVDVLSRSVFTPCFAFRTPMQGDIVPYASVRFTLFWWKVLLVGLFIIITITLSFYFIFLIVFIAFVIIVILLVPSAVIGALESVIGTSILPHVSVQHFLIIEIGHRSNFLQCVLCAGVYLHVYLHLFEKKIEFDVQCDLINS